MVVVTTCTYSRTCKAERKKSPEGKGTRCTLLNGVQGKEQEEEVKKEIKRAPESINPSN